MRCVIVLKYLWRLIRLCPLLALFVVVQPAQAQTTYAPITAENAAQITQIERIGNGTPRSMAFSTDGMRLAIATTLGVWVVTPHALPLSAEPSISLTQGEIGDTEMRLLEEQGGAESVVFSPGKAQLAAGGDDGSVMVWRAANGAEVERLENHLYPVTAITWSGNLLASGDQSGVVRLWNTMTWREMRVFQTANPIRQLLYHTAATQLTAFSGDQAITWDIAGGVLYQVAAPPNLRYTPNASIGERQAIYAADTGQIEIWDKNKRSITLDGFYGEMGTVYFSEAGRVGADEIAPTHVWSLEMRESTAEPPAPLPILSPDGSLQATFGNDGVIHLLDATTGQEIAALHGHIRAVKAVAFSPDGQLLASASNDGTIGIWNATVNEDSAPLVLLRGHTSGVTDVAFNAEGTLIASSGYDGTVRVWGMAG